MATILMTWEMGGGLDHMAGISTLARCTLAGSTSSAYQVECYFYSKLVLR
jgi:hypothetical protein